MFRLGVGVSEAEDVIGTHVGIVRQQRQEAGFGEPVLALLHRG
jgi:hypothetical protein